MKNEIMKKKIIGIEDIAKPPVPFNHVIGAYSDKKRKEYLRHKHKVIIFHPPRPDSKSVS